MKRRETKSDKIFYLASPYSHKDPEVRQARYDKNVWAAGELTGLGLMIFSPIVHNHPIKETGKPPSAFIYWMTFDLSILRNCAGLLVMDLEGVDESAGVGVEISLAKALDIPIWHLDEDMNDWPEAGDLLGYTEED